MGELHALGDMQHMHPINMALEGLYTLSLHFDVRTVRIGSSNDETGAEETEGL